MILLILETFSFFPKNSPKIKNPVRGSHVEKNQCGSERRACVNKHTKIHLSNNYKQNVGQMFICVVELLLLKVIVVLLVVVLLLVS